MSTRIEIRRQDLKLSTDELVLECVVTAKELIKQKPHIHWDPNVSRMGWWEVELGYDNNGRAPSEALYHRLHHCHGGGSFQALRILAKALQTTIEALMTPPDNLPLPKNS